MKLLIQMYAKEPADFFTATCLEWRTLLSEEFFKEIVVESLRHLTIEKRVRAYAFVIMNNHIHLIWQTMGENQKIDVQRDFLRFTGQQILMHLRYKKPVLHELFVGAKDRKYQVWERNALSIPLYTGRFLYQKLEYIHYNPVRAGLCKYPEQYKYSSAEFYYRNKLNYDFLTHEG